MSNAFDVKAAVDGLEDDLLCQIASLRCAYSILSSDADDKPDDEDRPAARNVLCRAIKAIDEIHNRLDGLAIELFHSPTPPPLRLVRSEEIAT